MNMTLSMFTKYARHSVGCPWTVAKCTCGLIQIMLQLEQEERSETNGNNHVNRERT
jgi:hypothetical protein